MKTPEDEAFDDVKRRQGGFYAKRAMAADKDALFEKFEVEQPAQEPDMLTIAYQSGYHDGKKAALAAREWNFCERCGKRTEDLTVIHTCTPPQEKNHAT
jgi:hypothetical protein